MNKLIIPTGYMGSGSSAITDLLSEIDGYDADTGTFEYVFLHCPNGVFDLEDKLLIGNNALRSDEALHSFRKTMKQLYDKKYWWVGHYNKNLSPRFMEYTEEYINSLIQFHPQFFWYYQENADFKMIIKLIFKRLVELVTFKKAKIKKPLLYEDLAFSYIDEDQFYQKTKTYLNKLWGELGIENRNVILDQLLLPFNLFRVHKYFDNEQAKVFVVERDPRDVFIINKYIWSKKGGFVPYPTDVNEFCECYKALRKMEKPASYSGIFRLNFEDLVYDYENTVLRILEFLDVKPSAHTKKFNNFNPKISIDNTQLFLANPEFLKEAKIIEKQLSEFLYNFPQERKPDQNKTF